MPAIAYPQNAMINFAPMNQALQFYANNQLERGRFGLQQNADLREQEMHPLRMDRERATTAGLWGAENRAQERQPYELRHLTAQTNQANAGAGLTSTQAQLARLREQRDAELHQYEAYRRWYEAAQPVLRANALAPLQPPGMPPQPTLPMPPIPRSAGGRGPTGGVPMAAPPMPSAAAPAAPPQPVVSNVPGISVAPPQAPQAMPAPAAAPQAPPQQPGTMPNGMTREAYLQYLLQNGHITQAQYQAYTRDGYLGRPEAVVTAGVNNANTAGTAAMTAQGAVTHLQGLLPLVDQAYVGALSGSREAAASLLQSFGYDPSALLQNQSLNATTLLRQGLAQLPMSILAELRPASNTDLTFATNASLNMNNNPETLKAGLRALIRVRQREAMFQTLLSQEFQRTPFPDRQAILARVLEAIPAAPVLPDGNIDMGQGGPRNQRRPAPGANGANVANGGPSPSQAAAPTAPIQPTARWQALSDAQRTEGLRRLITTGTPEAWQEFRQAFGDEVYHIARREAARRRMFQPGQQAAP